MTNAGDERAELAQIERRRLRALVDADVAVAAGSTQTLNARAMRALRAWFT